MKKKKGFTLIEIMCSMLIIAMLGTLLFTLFRISNKFVVDIQKDTSKVDDARLMISTLEEDIELSKGKPHIIYEDGTSTDGSSDGTDKINIKEIDIKDQSGNNIKYIIEVDPSNSKKKIIKRTTKNTSDSIIEANDYIFKVNYKLKSNIYEIQLDKYKSLVSRRNS